MKNSAKHRGEIEVKFYKKINTSSLAELIMLRSICPRFYGVVKDGHNKFVRLEDLTRPFRDSCIIDIKIGHINWDPNATDAKRAS